MSQRRKIFLKIGAASGILTPVLAFTCILMAIASCPEFSWTKNALSDLGIIAGITGPIFNFGLYSSGLSVFSFAVFGLFEYLGKSWLDKIGASTFAATGMSLMGIGFFPENIVPYHYLFSVLFFVLLSLSLFLITGAFAFKDQTKMALFTLLTAGATAIPWILYFFLHFVSGVAIPEFVSAVAGSVWVVLLSYEMFAAASQSNTE